MDSIENRLKQHCRDIEGLRLRDAFADDPDRFHRFSIRACGLLLDYSKNRITADTMALLFELARTAGVEARREAMFAGERINTTEDRAALHVALRNRSGRPMRVDGADVMPDVEASLAATGAFADGVRSGAIAGAPGSPFADVVNIGIGGSDLGPAMAAAALRPYADGPRLHFVSNVDGAHLHDSLSGLAPDRTLFIVSSKTFTTLETMANARSARAWLARELGEDAVARHFAAVSTNMDAAREFGIPRERVFGFWDWVGGRYSVWSAIGLPLMISIGPRRFDEFLAGAHELDEHFRSAPLERNLSVILALIGVWYRNYLGFPTYALLPYDQRLARFPAYVQQLDMESSGKSVRLDGRPVDGKTGPIVWGEPGTNGQHAFYQLLHQGTDVVPCDFLIAALPHEEEDGPHHAALVANCFAQSEALMRGRTEREVRELLASDGWPQEEIDRLAPHRSCPGDRPSNTLLYRKLDPATLGRIIALYEHKVFVQGAIWGINSFDQWGVELGKELATDLLPSVRGEQTPAGHDSSTDGLIAACREFARD